MELSINCMEGSQLSTVIVYRPSTKVYEYSSMLTSNISNVSAAHPSKHYPCQLIVPPFLLINFPQLKVLLFKIQDLRKKVFSSADSANTYKTSKQSPNHESVDEGLHLLMSLDRLYDSFSRQIHILQRRITAFYLTQCFLFLILLFSSLLLISPLA